MGAELGIALANGLWAFKTMLPAAVALAPALLKGALKVKVAAHLPDMSVAGCQRKWCDRQVLVPQSSIPGMFIVMLPWLYCPLVWVVYNIAFHLVGNLYFFFGLILQTFAPMT